MELNQAKIDKDWILDRLSDMIGRVCYVEELGAKGEMFLLGNKLAETRFLLIQLRQNVESSDD